MAENESAADYGCQEYFKEAVCIDAQRVYDSCSDKDCIEDIRVLFPAARQSLVDSATNVRVREVDVITVYIDLQPIPFNKGFYSVDMTFFFDVCLDLFGGTASCPVPINGVAIFNKKVVLYGSEGNVKLFTSGCSIDDVQAEDARVLPKATVQVAQPVALSAGCASIPPAAASPIAASPRASASATAATSTAAPRRTRCTSPLGCSSSCRWCATCKCSSPPTTSVCPRRSAWPPATIPASSSAASTSPPASFSRRSPQTWVGPVNDSRRQAKRERRAKK